METVDNLSDMH